MTSDARENRHMRLTAGPFPEPPALVAAGGRRGDADQSVQPPRGGEPDTALRALAQMGADLLRRVARLLPVDFGGKSGSTVDTPHASIISHNVPFSQKPGYRRVRNRASGTLAAVAAVGLLALTGCGQADGEADRRRGDLDYYLDLAETPMTAPDHEFQTMDGEPWSFTGAPEDRLTLLYFGYTSCPDVCPTTMADLTDAMSRVGADAERIDVVMVSTDPARDTAEQMRSWLTGFDPDFEGVIGPIDEVVQAAQAYGIPVEPPQESDGDYLVTHGERVAVLRPGGDAIGFFDPGTSGEQMSAVLPDLLTEQL